MFSNHENFAERAASWYQEIAFHGLYDLQGWGDGQKFYYSKENRRKLPLEVEMLMAKRCYQTIILDGDKLTKMGVNFLLKISKSALNF